MGRRKTIGRILREAQLYAFQVEDRTDPDAAARERALNFMPERHPWEEWAAKKEGSGAR